MLGNWAGNVYGEAGNAEVQYIAPRLLQAAVKMSQQRPALRFVLPVVPGMRHVVELRIGEAYFALHDIVDDRFAFLWRLEAYDKRRIIGLFRRITVTPATIIADGLSGSV